MPLIPLFLFCNFNRKKIIVRVAIFRNKLLCFIEDLYLTILSYFIEAGSHCVALASLELSM